MFPDRVDDRPEEPRRIDRGTHHVSVRRDLRAVTEYVLQSLALSAERSELRAQDELVDGENDRYRRDDPRLQLDVGAGYRRVGEEVLPGSDRSEDADGHRRGEDEDGEAADYPPAGRVDEEPDFGFPEPAPEHAVRTPVAQDVAHPADARLVGWVALGPGHRVHGSTCRSHLVM